MPKYRMSLSEARRYDRLLMELASYEVSKGLAPTHIETGGELIDFQKEVLKKFNYFKKLVQTGEITLDELEDDVVSRNGPFYVEPEKHIDDLDKFVEDYDKAESEKLKEPEMVTDSSLGSILRDIVSDFSSDPKVELRFMDVNGFIDCIEEDDEDELDEPED